MLKFFQNAVAFGFVVLFLAACTTASDPVGNTLGSTAQNTVAQVEASDNKTPATNQSVDTPSPTALAPVSGPSAAESAANAQATGEQLAAIAPTNRLAFLPIEGTPQDRAYKLTGSIRDAAARYGLSVLPASQSANADYRVKGYFSALNDGNGTMLVYIWDVLDGSGKRVHRINGQERTSTRNNDPWFAISDTELSRVADATAARLNSWVSRQ